MYTIKYDYIYLLPSDSWIVSLKTLPHSFMSCLVFLLLFLPFKITNEVQLVLTLCLTGQSHHLEHEKLISSHILWEEEQLSTANRSSVCGRVRRPSILPCKNFGLPDLVWAFFRQPELLQDHDGRSCVMFRRQHFTVCLCISQLFHWVSTSFSTIFPKC